MLKTIDAEAFTKILMCPVCHSDLEINESGNLLCKGCGEEYRIKNGIPIMLPSSSDIIDKEFVERYQELGANENYARDTLAHDIEEAFFYRNLETKDKVILDMGGSRYYYE